MEEKERVYKILKLVESGVPFHKEEMGMEDAVFTESMEQVFDDRLVENISFSRSGNTVLSVQTQGVTLTRRGKDFIFLKESGRL